MPHLSSVNVPSRMPLRNTEQATRVPVPQNQPGAAPTTVPSRLNKPIPIPLRAAQKPSGVAVSQNRADFTQATTPARPVQQMDLEANAPQKGARATIRSAGLAVRAGLLKHCILSTLAELVVGGAGIALIVSGRATTDFCDACDSGQGVFDQAYFPDPANPAMIVPGVLLLVAAVGTAALACTGIPRRRSTERRYTTNTTHAYYSPYRVDYYSGGAAYGAAIFAANEQAFSNNLYYNMNQSNC